MNRDASFAGLVSDLLRRAASVCADDRVYDGPVNGCAARVSDACHWRREDVARFLKARGIYSLLAVIDGTDADWISACKQIWEAQSRELCMIVTALSDAGARPLVFKGAELVHRYLRDQPLDVGADFDIIVLRDALDTTKAVLYAHGYTQSVFRAQLGRLAPRDIADVGRIEAHHYELAPFRKMIELRQNAALAALADERDGGPLYIIDGRLWLVLECDIHHNVALDVDVHGLFDRAVASSWGCGETLSDADHLWVNLSRLYTEYALHGASTLRPLAYTMPVVANAQVDWNVVVAQAKDMELGPSLYYLLATCAYHLPGAVPEEVLQAVYETKEGSLRDWGWQLARPFGFREVFPAYAFARLS